MSTDLRGLWIHLLIKASRQATAFRSHSLSQPTDSSNSSAHDRYPIALKQGGHPHEQRFVSTPLIEILGRNCLYRISYLSTDSCGLRKPCWKLYVRADHVSLTPPLLRLGGSGRCLFWPILGQSLELHFIPTPLKILGIKCLNHLSSLSTDCCGL